MSDPVHAFREVILAALGRAPDVIEPGRFIRFPTRGRRGDDAGWCKLFADLRGGVFGCYRVGISEVWSATDARSLPLAERAAIARQVMAATAEREREQRRQWAVNAERIAELWASCVPLVPGDPVTLYLKHRGIGGVWPLPDALRLHRALPYWHDGKIIGTFPAMVAPVTSPEGRMVAMHRTWLTADGRKAAVPSPKKLSRTAGPLTGASIALHRPARGGCIGIAEGIETALAAWRASAVPTVAAYCAGSLAAWRWPAGVQRLAIFADADKAGREAAGSLRARAFSAGLRAQVLTPTTEGQDWADVWATGGAVAIDTRGAA